MVSDVPHKSAAEINRTGEKEAHDSSVKFSAQAATAQREGGIKSAPAQPDTASKHLPADVTIVGADKEPAEHRSFLGNVAHQSMLFGEGLVSGSVSNAYNGVKQLVDHATGQEYKPTELFSNQKEVDGSIAGRIGSTVGTVADFAALTVATGGALGAVGIAGIGAGAFAVGTAGAIEGGLLTPSDDKHFATGRLIDAGIGATSGVVGMGAGLGVKALADGVGNAVAAAAVRVGGGIGVGATLGAGIAEATALATTGKSASADQLEFGAATGAVGGALGGVRFGAKNGKGAVEKPASDRTPPQGDSLPAAGVASADAHLAQGMKTGQVAFAPKSLDSEPRRAVSATVDIDGRKQDVLIRAEHNPADAAASEFHKLTDFTSAIPETTSRSVESLGPEGKSKFPDVANVSVQQRVGKLIEDLQSDGTIKESNDQLAKRVEELTTKGTNDPMAQQIEQAVAERTILGDHDIIDFNNITMSKENGQWKAANIDFDKEHGAFDTEHTPWGTSPLSGMQISEGTLRKISTLVNKLETQEGREHLTQIGLDKQQSDALIARAQYLLTNKKFPPSDDFDLN